ncbi:MAG: ribonuclease HI family protein [Candidatus Shapirobacteria bacterium]
MAKLVVFTDGAARGNPGPAGAGFVVKNAEQKIIFSGKKFLGKKTNNEAEYEAVLLALNWLDGCQGLSQEEVEFYLDSQLLANQLSGNWKIKANNLKPLIFEIKRKIASLEIKARFFHLPREKNSRADYLANLAIDEKRNY